MICSSCGAMWPDGQQWCECGASVLDAPPVANIVPVPVPTAEPAAVSSAGSGGMPSRSCAACATPLPRGAKWCLNCEQPVGSAPAASPTVAVALAFPWGAVPLRDGDSLFVGRSHASPLSRELDTFDDVSRKHATARVVGGTLLVIDHGSLNGTWLNGSPVSTSVEEQARPGDQLRFGTRLHVTVERIAERRP